MKACVVYECLVGYYNLTYFCCQFHGVINFGKDLDGGEFSCASSPC